MKSTSDIKVTIKLEMDLREARWLQGVMQNPLYGRTPGEELDEDRAPRIKLFRVLKDQTENHA